MTRNKAFAVCLAFGWLIGRPADFGAHRGDPQAGRRPAQQQSQDTIYLPIAVEGQWTGAVSGAATAAARAATQRAATGVAETATAGARTPTPSLTASASPSASPTGPTATASITPIGSTLTPRPTPTTWPTPTDGWPMTPGPTATMPNPLEDRIVPAGALIGGATRVDVDPTGNVLRLRSSGAEPVVFEWDRTHPDNLNGRLTIREVASNRYPVAGGGLYYQTADGRQFEPRLLGFVGRVQSVEHEVVNSAALAITVTETLHGVLHRKRYDVSLAGRSLTVRFRSLDGPRGPAEGAYVAAATGDMEGTSAGVNIRLPYMEAVPVTMLDQRWFISSLLDFTRSHADALIPRGPEQAPGAFRNELLAFYTPDVSGRIAAVDETFYVTVSDHVNDTFPAPHSASSPHERRLAHKAMVVLDPVQGSSDFVADAAYLERLADLRIADLLVVKSGWHDPAVRPPAQGPPDPAAGGAVAWDALASAASALAPAVDYTQTVPPCPGGSAPLYAAADRLSHSDETPKSYPDRLWGCGERDPVSHYLLAPDAAARLAAGPAAPPPEADAAFVLDLATWNPGFAAPAADGNLVDRAGAHPSNIRTVTVQLKLLLAYLQRRAGPVLAAGAYGPWELGFGMFLPGYLDGVTGEVANGSPDGIGLARHIVVPDYAVTQAPRRVARYGMGAYERFFGPIDQDSFYPVAGAALDEWRATALSYGNAPAWQVGGGAGEPWLLAAEEAREYFLGVPIAARLDGQVGHVAYESAQGTEIDLSEALRGNLDLARPRLRVSYDTGATLWVNHGDEMWQVVLDGVSYRLPLHGWLVSDEANGILGYSAMAGDKRVDYLVSGEWIVMDGRGQLTEFPAGSARDLVVVFPDGAELTEGPDGHLVLASP